MYNTKLKSRELLRVKLNSRTPFIPQHSNIEYHTCFEISFLKFLTQDRPNWKNSQIILYLLYVRESSSWWICIWLNIQIEIDLCFFCQFVSWNAQKGHVLGLNVLVQTVVNSVLIFATLDSTLNAKVFFISMLYKKKMSEEFTYQKTNESPRHAHDNRPRSSGNNGLLFFTWLVVTRKLQLFPRHNFRRSWSPCC